MTESEAPEPQPRKRPSSEERNAAVRATIVPLGPDERPPALKVAVAVCALLALGNVLTMALGVHVSGNGNPANRAIGIAALLTLIGAGMWVREAVAFLVFEALLIATCLFAFFGIVSAANLAAVLISLLVLGLSMWLFWKLIRVLARIQAPRNGTPGPETPAR
jgi:hypothetical protein